MSQQRTRKPFSAYFLFYQANKTEVLKNNDFTKVREILRKRWANLPSDEKVVYEELAEYDKKLYLKRDKN